ncbi:MAG: fibronectin type III domain-containing protein [Eubacterium sp.]|nr:fibronectin type III domain-containing protein [Eubacterium sp.]
MNKKILIIISVLVLASTLFTTTVYGDGDIDLPPIPIHPSTTDAVTDSVTESLLPSTDNEFEAEEVSFPDGDVTESTSKTAAPQTTSKPVKKPARVKLKKLVRGRKKITVKWKKVKGAKGYQIQYTLKKGFKGKKKSIYVKNKTLKRTVKKLKAKRKYYVRVRAYKLSNGKKIYGKWSKVRAIKTK